MGKRTRAVSEDYESIANKIRKLEQKLMRTRRRDRRRARRSSRLSSSSSSDTSRTSSRSSRSSRSRSASGSRSPPPDTIHIEGVPIPATSATAATNSEAAPLASTSATAAAELSSASVAQAAPGTSAPTTSDGIDIMPSPVDPTPDLDRELLLILGEDPTQAKSYGEPIQPDLAIRLQHIARTGLQKDIRKELTDKYLPPANCTLIEAPFLNPEVIAAVPEAVVKRDKGIELRQKQRSSTISCVAEAITLLMSSEPKNTGLIQILMDAIKLLCDSQNMDSNIRRSFVLNCLKKDLKDQLQATKIDKLLFGEGLAETLKAAKAISKSGADMKPTSMKQTPVQKKTPQKHLNWRAPPQNNRPKGTQRTKAYKDRPASSSKPSSRQAQNRSRNRH